MKDIHKLINDVSYTSIKLAVDATKSCIEKLYPVLDKAVEDGYNIRVAKFFSGYTGNKKFKIENDAYKGFEYNESKYCTCKAVKFKEVEKLIKTGFKGKDKSKSVMYIFCCVPVDILGQTDGCYIMYDVVEFEHNICEQDIHKIKEGIND